MEEKKKKFCDLVIVAVTPKKAKREQMAQDIAVLIGRLEDVGLDVKKQLSDDHEKIFLFVGVGEEILEAHAELRHLELCLKVDSSADGNSVGDDFQPSPTAPFRISQRELFAPTSPESLFTSTQRQRLVLDIIESPP